MPTDPTPLRVRVELDKYYPDSECDGCNEPRGKFLLLDGNPHAPALHFCANCLRSLAEQATALLTPATEPEPPTLSLDAQHLQDEMNRINGDGWVAKDVSPTCVRVERLNEFVECCHAFNGGNPMWFCSRASGAPRYFIAPWKRITPNKES